MPMRSMSKDREVAIAPQSPYSDQYVEACFWSWYNAGQPMGTKLATILEPDEYGRVPSMILLNRWKRERGWEDRARELNAKVTREIEKRTIAARVEMLDRHAKIARDMAEKGWEFLQEKGIDTASSALRAVDVGTRIERESLGMATAIKDIAKKKNDQLINIVSDLLDKAGKPASEIEDEIIEGEAVELDDVEDE